MRTARKETGILCVESMVRAYLEGRKTQTRRVIKPQPVATFEPSEITPCLYLERENWTAMGGVFQGSPEGNPVELSWFECATDDAPLASHLIDEKTGRMSLTRCRYGQPGDRLWVRETFGYFQNSPSFGTFYRADADSAQYMEEQGIARWIPSIFMPRKASRITLEITAIRVERVQDISEADAIAEGWDPDEVMPEACGCYAGDDWECAKDWYAFLWKSINGPGSWNANPFVWVLETKPVQGGRDG